MIAVFQGQVVLGLMSVDEALDEEVTEHGVPAREDEALPESSHASVTVDEGVDALELVMEDRAGDERVGVGRWQPGEGVGHSWRRCDDRSTARPASPRYEVGFLPPGLVRGKSVFHRSTPARVHRRSRFSFASIHVLAGSGMLACPEVVPLDTM